MQLSDHMQRSRAPWFLRLVTPLLRARSPRPLFENMPVTLILSTGRTGTVYLADLIDQAVGVISVHEPKPSRVLIAWTSAFLEGRVSIKYMAAVLANKRHKALGGLQADRYVESNNFIAGFADAAQQVFTKPTIIHIVRDPRDFATSVTNRGDSSGIRGFLNRWVPYLAYVPKGMRTSQLTALTRPLYRWTAINTYLSEYGKDQTDYHYFRFEDIFDMQRPDELTRLLRAVGLTKAQIAKLDFAAKPRAHATRFSLLDRPASSSNASKQQRMKPWREWTPDQARQCQQICGDLMAAYGYGGEPEWQQLLNAA